MDQSEFNIVSLQIELEVPPNQKSTEAIRIESTARSTGNQPLTTLRIEPIVASKTQVNIISEASTLDGPSGLSIGEKTLIAEPFTSEQPVPTLVESSSKRLRAIHT